jgi:hypothetical protein
MDNGFLLQPIEGIQYSKLSSSKKIQAQNCSEFLSTYSIKINELILKVNSLLDDLVFQENTFKAFERSMKAISFYIGFEAQCPELESGKGPDALWSLGNLTYIIIECKNGATTQEICKHDCNQINGSINWFKNNYDSSCAHIPLIIHPSNTFTYESSPEKHIRVMDENNLGRFKLSVKDFIKVICENNYFNDVKKINELLVHYHLYSTGIIDNYSSDFKIKSK